MEMKKEPVLVIMAAGMGSRYGGLKQIDPVDEYGNIIIDFSIYDALRAGFKNIVFIIKHAIENEFKAAIGDRISKIANVEYVFQELDKLPEGVSIPEGRVKPWGTTHAILCAKDVIGSRPFAALNADDYYGPNAFKNIYDFLINDTDKNTYALMGYKILNTLTDNGHVARGVCEVDENGMLKDIHERTRIIKMGDHAAYSEDDGKTYVDIPKDATVSMNFWGFKESFLDDITVSFPANLGKGIETNPLKYEDFLPEAVRRMLSEKKASVKVLTTPDRWFGVTYSADKPDVMASIKKLKQDGVYPEKLWS